jgi:hypothetical protein
MHAAKLLKNTMLKTRTAVSTEFSCCCERSKCRPTIAFLGRLCYNGSMKKRAPAEEQPVEQPVQPAALQFTPAPTAPPPQPSAPMPLMVSGIEDLNEKLDDILSVIHRHERRERLRSFGSAFKGLVWLTLVVGSTVYIYMYGEELMAKMAEITAQSAAKVAEQSSQTLLQQMQQQVSPEVLQKLMDQ